MSVELKYLIVAVILAIVLYGLRKKLKWHRTIDLRKDKKGVPFVMDMGNDKQGKRMLIVTDLKDRPDMQSSQERRDVQ